MGILDANNAANKGYLEHVNNVEGVKQRLTETVAELCAAKPELIEEAKLYTGTGVYSDDAVINSMQKEAPSQTLGM
ncbi:MAG: hypothetical protein IKG27_02750 [Bacilli bacterium]|nr:hypothetical protein [Bacilli bacterium]